MTSEPGIIEPGRADDPRFLKSIRSFYDRRWGDFDYAGCLQLERCEAILRAIRRTGLDRPRILDAGCGAGWLTGILASFGRAVGIDLAPAAIERARAMFPLADFVAGTLETWHGGPFDIVVSQEAIEHVNDQPRHLRRLAQALRPGGWIILTTPNALTWQAMPRAQRASWGSQPVEHLLTPSKLRSLLAADFTRVELSSCGLGYGRAGIRRVVNSERLSQVIGDLRLGAAWDLLRSRCLFGLHLIAVAQRR